MYNAPAINPSKYTRQNTVYRLFCRKKFKGSQIIIVHIPSSNNKLSRELCTVKNRRTKNSATKQPHRYYTPNTQQKQVILDIFTIFVNYAHFYVNGIM